MTDWASHTYVSGNLIAFFDLLGFTQEDIDLDVRNKKFICLMALASLAGCNSTSLNVKNDVVPDAVSCRPTSTVASEIASSQIGCHQGAIGNGVQVLLSSTTKAASMHSDSTEREMTSIFIQPANAVHQVGPTKFKAFYSKGLFDLRGKSGCVGILEDGSVNISKSARSTTLNYNLQFRLVSPLGWPKDCKTPRSIAGSVDL